MKNVLSVRLNEKAMGRLQDLARQSGKELSAVARELIDDGLVLKAMREYREGRLSLGTLASRLGLSLSETLDALAELGVPSPIGYEEYLEASDTARALTVRDAADEKRPSRRRPTPGRRIRRSPMKK